jgi:sulfofructose kinase
MTKSIDILGLGCVAVDDLLYVPSFPVANTKVRVLSWERQCGGLTGAALVTAARFGARCAFGGVLGLDELSHVIEENFLNEGVEVKFAPRAMDASVVHATVIVAVETGTRNIFYRINGRLGADDLLPTESVIRSARVLFLDHYGMVGNLRRLPFQAEHSGCDSPVPAYRVNEIALCDCQRVVAAALLRIRSKE